ncbi:MAG: MerR family transcriptional regulator [Hyphomicrobiaceae bacterium]
MRARDKSVVKEAEAFRTISEVADELGVPKHVLRFWEARFSQIKPMKRGGGRRFYRPTDVELLRGIQNLLRAQGYTIKGVQKMLREKGVEHVKQQANATAKPAAGVARAHGTAVERQRRASEIARPAASADTRLSLIRGAIKELEACRALLSEPVRSSRGGAMSKLKRSHG